MKKQLLKNASVLVIACLCWLGITGCARNVDYVKEQAPEIWQNSGFQITAYEGYEWCVFFGGRVWYQLERTEKDGIIYRAFLVKRPFVDEIHIYNLEAINAIKP